MILALKVILKHKYKDYETALKELKLETLYKRRESLCLKFAKKSLKLNNFKKCSLSVKRVIQCNKEKEEQNEKF